MKKVIKMGPILVIRRNLESNNMVVMEDMVIKGTRLRIEEVATVEDPIYKVDKTILEVGIPYSTIMITKAVITVMNHMTIIMQIIGASHSKEDNITGTMSRIKCSSNTRTGLTKDLAVVEAITVSSNNRMVMNLENIIKTIMEMIEFIMVNIQIIILITIEKEVDRRDNLILNMKKRKDKWILMMDRKKIKLILMIAKFAIWLSLNKFLLILKCNNQVETQCQE